MGRFINADSFVSTGQGVLGSNMFAYCNNTPICSSDPYGMSSFFANSFIEKIRSIIKSVLNIAQLFKLDLTEEEKMFVATVVGEMGGEDTIGRKAVAHSIMNRCKEPRDCWSNVKNVKDVLVKAQYNAVDYPEYKKCMKYLDNRDGSIPHYETVIYEVLPIYYNLQKDFTGGIHYFFVKSGSKDLLRELLAQPDRYTEVKINGIDGSVYGCFRCEY